MPMQIQEIIHLIALPHQLQKRLLDRMHNRMQVPIGVTPLPVDVRTTDVAAAVAVDYPVDVDHGDDFEDVFVEEVAGLWGAVAEGF